MKTSDPRSGGRGVTQGVPGQRRLGDERQVAAILAVSTRTLQAWRLRGEGPPFVRLKSAVRYDLAVLDAWIESNTRQSTSDPGPAG